MQQESEKKIWKSWFWIKIFSTRQILNWKFYDASDFELKFLQRVRFWRINFQRARFWRNLKSTILKKKIFLKSTILKKICTQKITFCLILLRQMRKFCVSRAYLKSTILKKFFLKSMILNEKVFVKSVILNKNFFVLSDFKSTFLQRARFWTIYLSPPHVLFTSFSSKQPCTVTGYNIFIDLTIALVSVHTILFVLFFARTFTFDFSVLSHFILSMGLIYAETRSYQ